MPARSRTIISSLTSEAAADKVRIILAGNPDEETALSVIDRPGIDGLLLTALASGPDVFFAALEKFMKDPPDRAPMPVKKGRAVPPAQTSVKDPGEPAKAAVKARDAEPNKSGKTPDLLKRFRRAYDSGKVKIFLAAVKAGTQKRSFSVSQTVRRRSFSVFFILRRQERRRSSARGWVFYNIPRVAVSFLLMSLLRR